MIDDTDLDVPIDDLIDRVKNQIDQAGVDDIIDDIGDDLDTPIG